MVCMYNSFKFAIESCRHSHYFAQMLLIFSFPGYFLLLLILMNIYCVVGFMSLTILRENLKYIWTCLSGGILLTTFPFNFTAITWYKDSHSLTSAASVTFLNKGQVLEIEGAQISDTGIYKCVAVNIAGTAELSYSLQVHGKYYKTYEKLLPAPCLLF